MNYRLATIFAKKAFSADFTETIDIDLSVPISKIVILYRSTSQAYAVADSGDYDVPVAAIKKIEMVDGSDVHFSLTGKEAQALDFYHNGKLPSQEIRFMIGNESYTVVNLNFGRFLYDPVLAYDPAKFKNPQLKITADISLGACDSNSGYLTVLGHVFHDKVVSPTGFLMAKEIKSYSLVDNGHEYTNLPTDFPYRKLLIRAQRAGYMPSQQIQRIKLTEDNDRSIVIDELTAELMAALLSRTQPIEENQQNSGTDTSTYYYCTPTQRARVQVTPWRSTSASLDVVAYGGSGGRYQYDASSGGPNFSARIMGYCPHGVIDIPFGQQNEIDDWYDVTEIGSVKADITGDESTGTCEIMLQQLRKY